MKKKLKMAKNRTKIENLEARDLSFSIYRPIIFVKRGSRFVYRILRTKIHLWKKFQSETYGKNWKNLKISKNGVKIRGQISIFSGFSTLSGDSTPKNHPRYPWLTNLCDPLDVCLHFYSGPNSNLHCTRFYDRFLTKNLENFKKI